MNYGGEDTKFSEKQKYNKEKPLQMCCFCRIVFTVCTLARFCLFSPRHLSYLNYNT